MHLHAQQNFLLSETYEPFHSGLGLETSVNPQRSIHLQLQDATRL